MSQELYELAVQGSHNGEPMETVMHFQGDNLTANETLLNGEDLCNSFIGSAMASWLGTLPASYQVHRLQARRASPNGSATAHKQFPHTSNPGTLGSIGASYQLCPTCFLIPTLGTKTGGKIFMPTIATTMVSSNVYNATYLTAIDTLMAILTNNFGTGSITWQLAVLSRKLGTWDTVVSWQMSQRFGFQKRRRTPIGA